jgi:sulfoxide reductase catalytic subunit YedY
MLIRRSPGIAPSEIASEALFLRRREILRAAAGLVPLALAGGCARADEETEAAPATAPRRPHDALDGVVKGSFATEEPLTRWQDVTGYNNYYEFGTGKDDPHRFAQVLRTRPWTVTIAGEAERTGEFAVDDLIRPFQLEERIYRLRCVEGWSMVVPWVGVPLAAVLKQFAPTSRAKYVAFTTLHDRDQMPGQLYPVLRWPYREGLRIDEAVHPLTLLVVGVYGRVLPNQNGAPLRLVVPWKYGFKSVKALVRIEFSEQQPPTSWNDAAPDEYGFYANVNPAVDHPRWSQKTERRIAGGQTLFGSRIPTLPFNGYAEQVASLYAGMDLRRQF